MVSKTSTGLASIQLKLPHSLLPRTSDDLAFTLLLWLPVQLRVIVVLLIAEQSEI